MRTKVEGFVFAGGQGKRMGTSKAALKFGESTFLERAVATLQTTADRVRVVAASSRQVSLPGVEVVTDKIAGAGPVGALYSALLESETDFNLILPCDTPLVKSRLCRAVLAASDGFDAVIPLDGKGRLQPVHGCYSFRCRDPLLEMLKKGERRLHMVSSLDCLRIRLLPAAEAGISDRCFFNVNRPADLEKLGRMMKKAAR